jgi:hypothetical protein
MSSNRGFVFRGNGEVKANPAVSVPSVRGTFHQMLVKGGPAVAGIGMKLDQSLGNVGQVQAGGKENEPYFLEKNLRVRPFRAMALRRSS